MSESRSVLSILKRGRLTSPSNNVKYSSFRDSCSTSIFHDRGYSVSLKDPSFDHTDAEHKDELSTRRLSLLHDYSEHSYPNLVIPVLSPIENENNPISLSERKEANIATDFLETPKQRTSTVDDSKCKNNFLSEPECLSPIHHNTSKDTIIDKTPNELSDSSLTSINDESTSLELLRTPTCCMLSETNEDKFLTPVSNLTADFNFDLLDINTPPTHVVSDLELSVPEDSGFNSLGLDKSEDSSSDHEGSFQELLQKQKEVSKLLDAKRKSRKLDRVRRLSTLRERGSQSETEEDYDITLINSEYKLKIARDSASEDSGLVFNEENNGDLVLNLGDLSRTPALQVVREIFLRSKRKRPEQNGLLENTERAEMSVLEYILAGLIGKKMGLEKLDILTELKYRDLKHILAIVLGALTVESLCSIWKVSKNWREIVIQDKNAYLRRKLYIKQLKAEAGGCLLHVEDAATRLNILSRSALRPVQAQAKTAVLQTPPYCNELLTPTGCSSVPQSTSKQEEYLKIAKTLFTDEALKPCPRCQCPAKYQPLKKRGLCSREACFVMRQF
ncbi:unnamed protein product [Caretta caretta]